MAFFPLKIYNQRILLKENPHAFHKLLTTYLDMSINLDILVKIMHAEIHIYSSASKRF